jgi:hypothetical protein
MVSAVMARSRASNRTQPTPEQPERSTTRTANIAATRRLGLAPASAGSEAPPAVPRHVATVVFTQRTDATRPGDGISLLGAPATAVVARLFGRRCAHRPALLESLA